MANEITVGASLAYANSAISIDSVVLAIKAPGTFSINGTKFVKNLMSVPTTAGGTAIPLGSVGTLGWAAFKNLDAVHFVELYNAVSGTKFGRVNAGETIVFRFAQSVTAPAAIADTSAVNLEYLILEN